LRLQAFVALLENKKVEICLITELK
jgi:hypothetical protein